MYILRHKTLALLVLMLLAVAPAIAQNVVYEGETSNLAVEQRPGDNYEWELYDNGSVNFATVPGNCPPTSAIFVGGNVGASVNVQWIKPGIYFFKVTARDAAGCTNNIKIGMMEVKHALPTATLTLSPVEICEGEQATIEVNFTGAAPWDFIMETKDKYGNTTTKQYTGIPATNNPYVITVSPATDLTFTVIEVTDMYGTQKKPSNSVTLTVHPLPQKTPIYIKKP